MAVNLSASWYGTDINSSLSEIIETSNAGVVKYWQNASIATNNTVTWNEDRVLTPHQWLDVAVREVRARAWR